MVKAQVLLRWLCVLALAVLSACRSSEKKVAPPPLRPLNVVLVTIDTLRADRLGCYGYSQIKTPFLDRVAHRGVLFENAVAQTPLTPPSHASMFTGMYPNAHGVRATGGFVLPSSATTLAEILREQGWDTGAFIGASVLKKLFGFSQGFAVYDDQMPKPDNRLLREYPERPAGQVVDRAIQWLNRRSSKPFFLWLHVYDPHIPYEPPAAFRQKYKGRPYDGEVAYTDQELGWLFASIEKKSPPEKTLIAVLSDHGEGLSEHGEYTHGVFLYDSTLRIPFIMAGPGVPAGLRVKQQARTIDLLPTLLELMGGKAPPGCQGASLVPAFSGEVVPTSFSYAETLYPKINMGWAELRAMRTDRWKYIRAPKPELYDLVKDPGETTNVIERYPNEVQELKEQLKAVASTGASEAPERVQTTSMDKRTVEQLKSLGYLGGHSPREFELTGQGIDPKDRVGILKLLHLAEGPQARLPARRRIALLRQALAEDPTNPAIYRQLGAAYERVGRHRDAMKLYQVAIQKGIQTGRLHSRIGDLYLREGKKDEAIAAYERASRLDPTHVESQNNLATAYLEKGRVADAERVFRSILATGEEYAAAYNGLGLIAIQRQDPAGARGYFERAVQLDPDLVEAQLNLGLIYKMAGDRARARACFQAFLAKAPHTQYGQIIPKVREEIARLQ